MKLSNLSSRQWFEEAARHYVEHHQGCPWCKGSHRVYQMTRGHTKTYSCQGCDFQASFDQSTGQYNHIIGEEVDMTTSPTMFEI